MKQSGNHLVVGRLVEVQAKHWLLQQQSGDFSPQQQLAFERWYQQEKQHRQEYDRLSALWGELDLVAEEVLVDFEADQGSHNGFHWQSVRVFGYRGWIAASLLFVVFFAGYQQFLPQTTPPVVEQYSSAKRELRVIQLEDGSVLELGSHSRVHVDFSDQQRSVSLLRGEAYFKVEKDPLRPFIVQTSYGRARAVGTEFEVHLGVEHTRVTVHEGVVEVEAKADLQALASTGRIIAGEQLSYGDDGKLSPVSKIDLELSAAWRKGQIVFDQQPLFEVVEQLNRYSRRKIVIGDRRLRTIRVNGVFNSGEIEALLGAIEASLPAELNRGEESITLRYQPAASG